MALTYGCDGFSLGRGSGEVKNSKRERFLGWVSNGMGGGNNGFRPGS